MTARKLIEDIQDKCGQNLDREVIFQGTVELAVQDDFKTFPVKYEDCMVFSDHPLILKISLLEN